MEYCPIRSLQELIGITGGLTIPENGSIFAQILHAQKNLHDEGIHVKYTDED